MIIMATMLAISYCRALHKLFYPVCEKQMQLSVMSGDEFCNHLFSMPQEIFEKKLERIRHSVDSLIIDGHPELHMSVSIGGAYGSGTAEKLFKVADTMMYQSKKQKSGDH